MSDMEWTAAVIANLRQLWADGHSTAEIGRRLGCSKNAVIGKARRMKLPRRQDPVSPMDQAKKTRIIELIRSGLTNAAVADLVGSCHTTISDFRQAHNLPRSPGATRLRAVRPDPVRINPPKQARPPMITFIRRVDAPDAPVRPAPLPVALQFRGNCQYPLWTNKPNGRYCDAPAILGRSYCSKHYQRCYVQRVKAA